MQLFAANRSSILLSSLNMKFTFTLLIGLVLLCVGGCRSAAVVPVEHLPQLYQVDNANAVNLSDVAQIGLNPPHGSAQSATVSTSISIYHKSSLDHPLVIVYENADEGYEAWEKLVAHFGNNLQATQTPVKPQPLVAPPSVVPPASATQAQKPDEGSVLDIDMRALNACVHDKLITDEEFALGRKMVVDHWASILQGSSGNGSLFTANNGAGSNLGGLHGDLSQLQDDRKTYSFSADETDSLRRAILTRYGFFNRNN